MEEEKRNWEREREREREREKKRLESGGREKLLGTPRIQRNCVPSSHIHDEPYHEFNK